MACSSDPAGQDLIDLNSPNSGNDVESYISCDEKDVMAIIVRNESHLRKRAEISRVALGPAISFGFPTTSELHYQCCVNEEFLARRLKRRYFQQHLEHRGEYQDFLRAAQVHLDARAALNSSIFSVQGSPQATNPTGNAQGAAPEAVRTSTVDSSSRTDDIEEAVIRPSHPSQLFWSESDDSSGTITASLPRTRRGAFSTISPESDDSSMTIRPSRPRAPSPPSPSASSESDNSAGWLTGSRPHLSNGYGRVRQAHDDLQFVIELDIDDEECGVIDSHEGGESSRLIELDDGETQEQENHGQDQFVEWSGFFGKLSDEWAERGMSRPHPPQAKAPLNSPEGIARLAEIRLLLGMKPDAKPLDVWNFATRNNDLMANITGSTLPIRHRHIGQAKRPGFDRDPGLGTVSDFADDKWELRKGFVDVWSSLNWTFEALSGPGPDVPRSSADENNCGYNESTVDELYRALNVEDFIADGVNIDDFNVGDDIEQGETHWQGNEEEERSFSLEGRRARIPFEVDFGGNPRAPRHQARNASRLRMSWTYVDPENPVSSHDSRGESVSPLSLPPTSPILQDEPVSSLSSPPTSPTSQDVLVSPLSSSLSSPLSPFHVDTIPPSLEDDDPSFEEPVLPPDSDNGGWSDSSGSISPRVFERMPPPSLVQSDSPRGKRLLSDLRKILAMPDSKTPQDISLFIDRHPELMKALRTGRVPLKKVPLPAGNHELRQQKAQANFNPLRTLRARSDRRQRSMRTNLALALKMLNWEGIDSEPLPFTPSSPWDEGFVAAAEGDQIDDDDDEECDHWARTTVSPNPAKIDKKYLIKHQVKKPSLLRTTLTRREPVEGGSPTQVDQEEDITTTKREEEEEAAATLSEPEIWEDVDLNVSSSLPRMIISGLEY
jgi:hypothetical protein